MKTYLLLLISLVLITFNSCKKEEPNPKSTNNSNTEKVLSIENGAVTSKPDGSVNYSAVLIDKEGNRSPASNVTWASSNTTVATIASSGQINIASTGVSTISASVTIDGEKIMAEAPLNIKVAGVFVVAPSAILVDTEFPNIQLEPVYLGMNSTTYSYQSSNTAIATVSSTGDVNFVGSGDCYLTVTANDLDGKPSVVIPVVVLPVPQVKLPITRITVSPATHSILKSETAQFTAKAYDSDGNEATTTFTWSVDDETIASIDASGNISPKKIGTTKVRALAEGVVGEAELIVAPDKVILVDPYYVTISPSKSKQFSATQYQVVRNNGELALGSASTPSNLKWEIPTYGFSMFDIATVDNSGNVTVKSNASPGLMTYVMVSDPNDAEIQPGIGSVSVAMASSCNCGTASSDAVNINISSATTVSLSLGQTAQIQAEVVDALGNAVSGATIAYCSDDVQVADIDASGEISITAITQNATTITLCHGSLSKTITVNAN
ncbi:MAG: hypothetical protein GY810_29375 [Aureispira sp.]|nr:hypothetical protein [Aureispira sp.]